MLINTPEMAFLCLRSREPLVHLKPITIERPHFFCGQYTVQPWEKAGSKMINIKKIKWGKERGWNWTCHPFFKCGFLGPVELFISSLPKNKKEPFKTFGYPCRRSLEHWALHYVPIPATMILNEMLCCVHKHANAPQKK